MSNQTKFPFGPDAAGAAAVRALNRAGGDWQLKTALGSVARVMGEFKRVEVNGLPEYVTTGRVSPSRTRSPATMRYQLPFILESRRPLLTPVGGGVYASFGDLEPVSPVGVATMYTIRPGVEVTYSVAERTFTRVMQFYNYFSILPALIGFQEFDSNPVFFPGYLMISRVADFVGLFPGDPPNRRIVVPFLTRQDGRTDSAGRRLGTPAYAVLNDQAPGNGSILGASFARPDAEFSAFIPSCVVKSATMWLLAEKFFRPGLVDAEVNYQPRLWLLLFPGHNFGAGIVFDVTSVAFPDAYETHSETFEGVEYFDVTSGAEYNTRLSETMGFMQVVAITGNRALFFYRLMTGNEAAQQWSQKILRLEYNGAIDGGLVYDQLITERGIIQHAVHLGEGRVLAKLIANFPGTGHAVSFKLSHDGGTSWADFEPAGFDAPLLNQFYGDFTVHRQADASREAGDREATVLINSWNPATGQYHVYSSTDNGASWSRKGLIARPTTFYRIDTFVAEDGGGNFRDLTPGPSYTRLVDITIPDRYVRD